MHICNQDKPEIYVRTCISKGSVVVVIALLFEIISNAPAPSALGLMSIRRCGEHIYRKIDCSRSCLIFVEHMLL